MVARARSGLGIRHSIAVPYKCKISGIKEILVLISDEIANNMKELSPVLSDKIDAILVSALLKSELCTCDLATISERTDEEVHARLVRLVNNGVLNHREINGMNYFRFADTEAGKRVATNINDELDV